MAINLNEFFNQAAQQSADPGVEQALTQYDAPQIGAFSNESINSFNMLQQAQAQQQDAAALNALTQQDNSFFTSLVESPQPTMGQDPQAYYTDPEDVTMDEGTRATNSLVAGFGQLSTQVGDMFTFIQSITPGSKYWLPYTDPIGNFFRSPGEDLTNKFQNTYVPKELEELTFSDLGNPIFWTGDVAQQIPNLMAMMSAGVGGARLMSSWMTRHAAKQVAKGAGKSYGVAVQGAKGLETLNKGKGVFGLPSMFTKVGKKADDIILSDALGKGVASTVGGGLGSTVIDGAMVAGQEYRHALDMGLDPEQAGTAAAGVFVDNAKWLGVNMLSWGITFGRLPGRLGLNVLNKQGLTGAAEFGRRAAKLTVNVAPRVAFESLEEMYQESYQDWIQKKNLAHVQGKRFTGKNGEDYEGLDGYLNYFNSKENQRTKYVSFATGLLGGGFGGIVNSMANRQSELDKQEARLRDGQEGDLDAQIESIIIAAVEDDVAPMLIDYLNEINTEGKFADGQLEAMLGAIEYVQEKYDNIPDFMDKVTGAGKNRILGAKIKIDKANNSVKTEEESLNKYKEDHKGQEETQEYKDNVASMEQALEKSKEVRDQVVSSLEKEILQIEKEALEEIEAFEKLRPEVDPKEVGELTQEQKELYITKDAEAKAEKEAKEETKEEEPGVIESIGKKVKEVFTGKEKTKEETKEETKPSIREQAIERIKKQKGENAVISEEEIENEIKEINKEDKVADLITGADKAKESIEEVDKKSDSVQKVNEALNKKSAKEVKKEMPEDVDAAIDVVAKKYQEGKNLSKSDNNIFDNYQDEVVERADKIEEESKKKVETEVTPEVTEEGEVEVKEDDSKIEPKTQKKKADPKKAKTKPETKEEKEQVEQIQELADKYKIQSLFGFYRLQEKLGVPIGLLDPQTSPYGASMAMEVAGSIWVTPNSLYQEQIVHELTGHIYFRINYDKPLIQEFIKKFIKTNEYALLKAQYPELLMYEWFGNEMTLHEVVGDIISRSTDARSRFRNLELINENRKAQGKRPIKKGPASEINELILQKATEYYENWNNGVYNTIPGQSQLIQDTQVLSDLFTRAKIGKVLPDSKQKGLQEEAWATYISDPGSGNIDNRARDIFANLFSDPKQNKERERTAKRFWNIVGKQGEQIKDEAKSILEMGNEELSGLSLKEMKDKLREVSLTITPEQLRSRRVTQSRIQMAKRDVSFTKAQSYMNAISKETGDYVLSEYNKKGSDIRKALDAGTFTKDMLKPKIIEISNKYGKNNPFFTYSGIDKYDQIIDGVIKNVIARVEFLRPGTKIHQIVQKETIKALKEAGNALIKDLGIDNEDTIEEMVNAGISISTDLTAQIWGIDNMDMQDMQDHANSLRAESELGASSDNTLGMYSKERDELITTLSAMMLDFERSFLSTQEGQETRANRKRTPFMKERSAGVLSTLLITAQTSPTADAFIKSIRSSKNPGVKGFVKYLEGKFGNKPMLVMSKNLQEDMRRRGSTDIYTDYFLSNVWVNMKSKTHENLFSTVVKDKEGRENNTLELFNEADVAFEEKQLINAVIDRSFNWYYSTAKDNPVSKRSNTEAIRRSLIAEAKRIKSNIDNNIDKDVTKDIINLLSDMFDVYAVGYFKWDTLYKSGVTFKGKNYNLVDWFSNEGIKYFRENTNRVSVKSFKDLLNQVAVNSRAFHYFTMLHNAENNPTNTMNTRSFILDQNERINNMFALQPGESLVDYDQRIKREGKAFDFISSNKQNEYAHNHFMPFEIKNGMFVPKKVNLFFRGGLITELRNRGLNYTRMTPQELMVSDMSDFFNSLKRGKDYNQGVSVFAEKTRMYYVQSPIFNNKEIKERLAWLEQYDNQTYLDGQKVLPLVSGGKFDVAAINKEVELIKKHMLNQKHLYINNTAFNGFFDKKGNFTKQADKRIALYVKNYMINSFSAQRQFIGDHSQFKSENDYTVRAAGAIARKTTSDNNITLDVTILKEDDQEDGQGYMLYEDLAEESAAFGLNLMRNETDTAKHLKYVYYGQDLRAYEDRLNNDVFGPNSSVYLKGNVIAITPEMARKSLHLRKIKVHLEQRKADLAKSGKGKIRVVAYNASAVKAFPMNIEEFSIDVNSTRQERMSVLNKMYIDNNGQYKGLDGNNFGVQLPLDKEKYTAVMASQSYAQHLTNITSENEEMSRLLNIAHRGFARSMQLQLSETGVRRFYDIEEYNDKQQVKLNQGLLNSIHESWAGTPVANMSSYVSPFFPKVNMVRNAILNKMLIETGTKIQAPGTVAFQMTDKGFGLNAHQRLGDLDYASKLDVREFGEDLIVSEVIVPASMKKNYNVGDVILASRIPSHGKASQPVLIIKDFFDNQAGSLISIPYAISKVMGSDLDGDALFVNGRHTGRKLKKSQEAYNRGWNSVVKVLGNSQFLENETNKAIDPDVDAQIALQEVEDLYGKRKGWDTESSIMLPMGRLSAFNENVPAGGMIGIAAVMQRDLNYLSHYEAELDFAIKIGDKQALSKFTDVNNQLGYYKTAQVLNIILDNPKYQTARKLGFTYQTIKPAMLMLRMGYTLGEVAAILNSKAAMKYSKYASERTVIYSDDKSYYTPGQKAVMEYLSDLESGSFAGTNIDNSIDFINEKSRLIPFSQQSYIKEVNEVLKINKNDVISIDVRALAADNINSNIEVIRLLDALNKVGTEVFNAGRVIGAYGLKIQNGFEIDKLLNDYNKVGTKDSLFKEGSLENYRRDPLVKQNISVLNQIKNLDRITNLQYSSESVAVQKAMNDYVMPDMENIFEKSPVNVRNYQLFRMRNELSVLEGMQSKDLLYAQIKSLVEQNANKPADEQNLFLTSIRLYDDTKSVNLNTRLFDAFISPEDITRIQQHFNELDNPNSIYKGTQLIEQPDGTSLEILANNGNNRKLFIQMDFLQNGWIGSNSTSVAWSPNVFGSEFNINEELSNMLADNDRNVSKDEAENKAVSFLEQYPYSAPKGKMIRDGEVYFVDNSNNFILKKLRTNNKKHVAKSYNANTKQYEIFVYNPQIQRYEYKGETKFSPVDAVNHDKANKVVDYKKRAFMSLEEAKAAAASLRNNSRLNKAKVKYVGDVKVGRIENPAQFTDSPLNQDQYFKMKGITPYMRMGRQNSNDVAVFYNNQYNRYVQDHESALAYYKEFIENDEYKNFSDARLTEDALIFSRMDKVVHDNIMEFIGIELAERIENKQIATIAQIAKENNISLINNDLGSWESWLISNNLHQTNADVQGIVNKLERDYQQFAREWRRQAKDIKMFADEIIKEKTKGLSAFHIMKRKLQGKYDIMVWGGLVKKDTTKDGRTYVRLKTEDELGRISDAEKVFYDGFKSIIKKYYPEASETMVPHKSIGGFSALMRHGLFGLYRSGINSTADINHIIVKGERPDGVTDFMKYKEWEAIYSQGSNNIEKAKNITKLNALRKKAIEAGKRGVNDDGSPIVSGVFERKAFQESDVFFNFIDSKKVSESDLGTMDLQEILLGTLHSNMYKYGLRNNMDQYLDEIKLNDKGYRDIDYNQWAISKGSKEFLGMQANLPLIDGAIHLNKIRGNKEMVKYLNEVWRDNILGGKKQKSFGGEWDWAINKVVDLTTIAFLGFKPAIAVGNVIMGKYQQLRSRGGKEFILGEKRFWQGFMGGESLFKRAGEALDEKSLSKTLGRNKTAAILNELMKFEFYQYENVSSVSKSNPLFRVALFPLDQSEKWIQGAMFLGMMTEKQWNSYDVNEDGDLIIVDKKNALTSAQIRKMSYEVKKQQGFGYSPMDQRRLSLYSWGRAMGQFKRYFFTLGRERFGKETIDMYGNPDIGSYRASFEFVKDMYQGKKSMKDFDKLPEHRRKAIERYLTGVAYAIGAMMIVGLTGDDEGDDNYVQSRIHSRSKKFLGDQNVFFNPQKLMFMSKPPAVGFVQDRLGY